MGPVFWVVLAGIGVAGYFGYRRLQTVERELRQEVAEEQASYGEAPAKPEGKKEGASVPETGGGEAGAATLEERLLEQIRKQPGILQTELYGLCPGESRRTVQDLLRKLDGKGQIARTKEKGTYRLHPVQ